MVLKEAQQLPAAGVAIGLRYLELTVPVRQKRRRGASKGQGGRTDARSMGMEMGREAGCEAGSQLCMVFDLHTGAQVARW